MPSRIVHSYSVIKKLLPQKYSLVRRQCVCFVAKWLSTELLHLYVNKSLHKDKQRSDKQLNVIKEKTWHIKLIYHSKSVVLYL